MELAVGGLQDAGRSAEEERGRHGAEMEARWACELALARGDPGRQLGGEEVWAAWHSGELDPVGARKGKNMQLV